MTTITGHTTRANGTVLTATIYNGDHNNHITNATALNTGKVEGATPPVVDGDAIVFEGTGGAAIRSAGGAPFIPDDGALPIANGGTGATSAAAAAEALGVGLTDTPQFAGLRIGHSSLIVAARNAGTVTPAAQIVGNANDNTNLLIARFADSNGTPGIRMGQSRGASLGTFTVSQDGDNLGEIGFMGADGTDFAEAARISAVIAGTPGAGDMPGRLLFHTSADGSEQPTERLRIDSDGALRHGGASGEDLREKWDLIAEGSGTTTTNVDIPLGNYDLMRLHFRARPTADITAVQVRFSVNGGGAYLSGASDYQSDSDASRTEIEWGVDTSLGSGADEGVWLAVELQDFNQDSVLKRLFGSIAYARGDGIPRESTIAGAMNSGASTNDVTHIRIFPDSSNWATYNYQLLGHRH